MDAEVAASGVSKQMEKDLRLEYGIDEEESQSEEEDDEEEDLIEEIGVESKSSEQAKTEEDDIEELRKEVEQSVRLAKVETTDEANPDIVADYIDDFIPDAEAE